MSQHENIPDDDPIETFSSPNALYTSRRGKTPKTTSSSPFNFQQQLFEQQQYEYASQRDKTPKNTSSSPFDFQQQLYEQQQLEYAFQQQRYLQEQLLQNRPYVPQLLFTGYGKENRAVPNEMMPPQPLPAGEDVEGQEEGTTKDKEAKKKGGKKVSKKAAKKDEKDEDSMRGVPWSEEEQVQLVLAHKQIELGEKVKGEKAEQTWDRKYAAFLERVPGSKRTTKAAADKIRSIESTYRFMIDFQNSKIPGATGSSPWFEADPDLRRKLQKKFQKTDISKTCFDLLDSFLGEKPQTAPELILDSGVTNEEDRDHFMQQQKVKTDKKKKRKAPEEDSDDDARAFRREVLALQNRQMTVLETIANSLSKFDASK